MDLAQATGAVEEVSLAGEAHAVRLLTLREWGTVTAWLKRGSPSPVTRAYIAIQQAKDAGTPLDREIEGRMLDRAEQAALSWPPRFGSEAWFDEIGNADGGDAMLLHTILSKTNPNFSLPSAEALAPKIPTAEWSELVRVALYGSQPRPKAGPGTSPNPTP